jgi:hypothetical protein
MSSRKAPSLELPIINPKQAKDRCLRENRPGNRASAVVVERMARPVCKRCLDIRLISLHKLIRSRVGTPAKMEIRTSWSS